MTVTTCTGDVLADKPTGWTRARKEAFVGWLFLSPWIVGFVLLKALPILAAFIFSLTDFKMLHPEQTTFVAFENYARFFRDPRAGAGLFGSIGYFLVTVPLEMVVALALAAIFTSERLKNKQLLRTLVFMTSIIPAASILFIFWGAMQYAQRLIFEPRNLPPLNDFGILVVFMVFWSVGPGFLIMYSAMESVPRELYESARVDGAGPLARFVFITLPVISPAIFFTLVINLTGAFGGAVLLDRGYFLAGSVSPMEDYINQVMFRQAELGYASALAWITFLVMMTITIWLFRSSKRWVYFPEEDENAEI